MTDRQTLFCLTMIGFALCFLAIIAGCREQPATNPTAIEASAAAIDASDVPVQPELPRLNPSCGRECDVTPEFHPNCCERDCHCGDDCKCSEQERCCKACLCDMAVKPEIGGQCGCSGGCTCVKSAAGCMCRTNGMQCNPLCRCRLFGASGPNQNEVYHAGKWWYYHEDKTWSVWDGKKWVPYKAAAAKGGASSQKQNWFGQPKVIRPWRNGLFMGADAGSSNTAACRT